MQYRYIYNSFPYSLPYSFLFFHMQNRHVGPTSCLSQSQADTWHVSSPFCGWPARGAHAPATVPRRDFSLPACVFRRRFLPPPATFSRASTSILFTSSSSTHGCVPFLPILPLLLSRSPSSSPANELR